MARSHQWSRENKAKTWALHHQLIPQCFSVTCTGWREIRSMSFEIMNQLLITIEIVQGTDYLMQKWLLKFSL